MTLKRLLIGCALWSAISAQYGAVLLPEGLSPRYYLGTSQELEKRQSGICLAGQHSCLDVNATACCDNDQYCVINNSFQPACCAIGSDCGLQCASSAYQCQSTTTVSGTASVTTACCPRSCTDISAFKCASSLGGGCCSYGFMCGAEGSCSSTVQPSTSSSAIVTEVPSGCTTSQSACPTSMGGGCCGIGWACTVIGGSNYCATASQTAVRTGGSLPTGISETSKPSSGLSSGAKAGIGGGIAGVSVIFVCGGLYFCLRHRRNAKEKSKTMSAPAMSQTSGSVTTKPRPSPAPRRQTAADYFGPAATAGPYTDHSSPNTTPGLHRGVPIAPQGPGDIAASVEIDSRDHSNVTSPGYEYQKGPVVNEYPFELP